jgi:hypothetical protein
VGYRLVNETCLDYKKKICLGLYFDLHLGLQCSS